MRSKKFALVKKYYDKGLWSERMVGDAVEKKWITAEEYGMIVGVEYNQDV